MRNKHRKSWLSQKISLPTILFIIIICTISIGIVYYWSFYHFSKIFEDRVIDQYTFEQNKEIGINNEWILGVTTDSIDVVEAIHGDAVSEQIYSDAISQEEITKLYQKKIDSKELLYMINLDSKNGETIYKYSIIKNIYKEVFPEIFMSFLIFLVLIVFVTIFYIHSISRKLYSNIDKLIFYTKELVYGQNDIPISLDTNDKDILDLAEAFEDMKEQLNQKEKFQQTALQYISHEMKTPIMIIKSYADSAKNNIFPNGTVTNTFDTIISQTDRIQKKVEDLITVIRINSQNIEVNNTKDFSVSELLNDMIMNTYIFPKDSQIYVHIEKDVTMNGNIEKIQIFFENMLENQIKYSENTIAIRLYKTDNYVNLLFYNDGERIESPVKASLFKPFVKGYNGNSGLGLSICKTIALQHHGDIKIIPTQKGTLFKAIFSIDKE